MGWGSFRDKYITKPARDVADVISFGHGEELEDYMTLDLQKDVVDKIGESATDTYHDVSGQTAEEEAKRASATQASAMLEQLDYLKEINKLPQEIKEQALTELSGAYGLGDEGFTDKYKESPIYQSIMRSKEAGEEGVLRHASTTGGLRSGNVQRGLYDYNAELENKGYMQYLQGLKGLSGVPTNEQQIGQTYGDIGAVQAAGITGAAQARQQGTSNLINLGLGIGGLLI